MESAKTAAAAAQRLPQKDADMIEQAREAAADVEWLHEQVCCVCLCSTETIVGLLHSPINKSAAEAALVQPSSCNSQPC